jgi:DNA-binding transcriptional LysR family regulator
LEINVKTFDMNLLRIMLAVWETRSISRAAEQVGMTQPATSNALARLRKTLNDPVFIRTKDGMIPSAAAERVLPELKRHVDGLFAAISEEGEFDPRNSARTFNLSLSGLGELMFMPRLLAKTMKGAPNIRLHNAPVPTQFLAQALRSNQVDLAIGLIDVDEADIRSVVLFQERYVLVAGAGLEHPPTSIEDLHHHHFALSAPETSYAQEVFRLVRSHGLEKNIVVRLAHISALSPLLDDLPLVSFLPEQLAQRLSETNGIDILPIDIGQSFSPVRMVWHDKNQSDPANQWLRDLVCALYSQS